MQPKNIASPTPKPQKARTPAAQNNVHLSKLSPRVNEQIMKPLLNRTNQISLIRHSPFKIINKNVADGVETEIEDRTELQDTISNINVTLRPTLELEELRERDFRMRLGKDLRYAPPNDNKFATTFGFSHGVQPATTTAAAGGVLIRKQSPSYRGTSHATAHSGLKDPKHMQICFSVASKASTMTQHIKESFSAIPGHERDDLDRATPYKSSALNKQSELASQMKMIEGLNKQVAESPISIMESESIAML